VLECDEQVWWQRRVFSFGGTYLSEYMASQERNINIHCNENNCRKIPSSSKNEHRFSSPYSYERLFRLILCCSGGK